jgi:hypothetical protein
LISRLQKIGAKIFWAGLPETKGKLGWTDLARPVRIHASAMLNGLKLITPLMTHHPKGNRAC